MERFCDKCGTLVQGEGKFCPSCGAPLESAVDLSKPAAPATEPMQSAPTVNTYTSPNAAQMPAYPQSYNNGGMIERTEDMSVGQWALTIFLSSLGLIGIILRSYGRSAATRLSRRRTTHAECLLFRRLCSAL